MPSDRPVAKLSTMPHYMVDVETLSRSPRAAIVGIGGVKFNPWTDEVSRPFSVAIDIVDVINQGFNIQGETVTWWIERAEAWKTWRAAHVPTSPLNAARAFYKWIADEIPISEEMVVWAFGSAFDIPILENFLSRTGTRIPWKYYNVFCARTVVKLAEFGGNADWELMSTKEPLYGVCKHDPLRDACVQARAAQYSLQKLVGCKFQEDVLHGMEKVPRV